LRQSAIEQLTERREWDKSDRKTDRAALVDRWIGGSAARFAPTRRSTEPPNHRLIVQVYNVADAEAAADAGATEIVLDPFLRHPAPSVTSVLALRDSLVARAVDFRLRTPTIVRPEDRKGVDKWLKLDVPFLTGHLGLLAEL